MICPRCADKQIDVMAHSPVKGRMDGIPVPALSLYLAEYRTRPQNGTGALSA